MPSPWTRCPLDMPLKHDPEGAATVLKRLKSLAKVRLWAKDDEDVQRASTYFANQSQAAALRFGDEVERVGKRRC